MLRKINNNPFRITILLIAILYFLYSCKREDTGLAGPSITPQQQQQMDKVNEWLNQEETKLSGDRPASVEQLRKSLDFSGIHSEALFDGQTALIVPVKKDFTTENSKGKSPVNSLVLRVDASGKITMGNIIQYLPKQSLLNSKMPVNFFHDFYNEGVKDMSGTVTFLSVAGELQAEVTRDKGKMVSHSQVQKKGKTGATSLSSSSLQCWDVWWVTYYPDGTSTWDYLYSYCDNEELPCLSAFQTNGKTYFVACDGGGGNGGDEPEMFRSLQWQVWVADDNSIGVGSIENVRGKRTGNGTGYFTSIHHATSNGWGLNQLYSETGYVVTNGGNYVSSEVAGKLFPGPTGQTVSGNKLWMYNEVF